MGYCVSKPGSRRLSIPTLNTFQPRYRESFFLDIAPPSWGRKRNAMKHVVSFDSQGTPIDTDGVIEVWEGKYERSSPFPGSADLVIAINPSGDPTLCSARILARDTRAEERWFGPRGLADLLPFVLPARELEETCLAEQRFESYHSPDRVPHPCLRLLRTMKNEDVQALLGKIFKIIQEYRQCLEKDPDHFGGAAQDEVMKIYLGSIRRRV